MTSEINELKSIKTKLIHEFIEVSKKDGQLQNMDTLMHTIKNTCKVIHDCEQEEEMGYSGYSGYAVAGRGNMAYSGYDPYYHEMPYEGEYSWKRGRGSGASRDSMGRYSSHGDMRSALYEAMTHASNDMERQQIQELINKMG